MASVDPITSVRVHTSTLRVLQEFKTSAQNWDSFLLGLIERELGREDLEYALRILEDYRGGKVSALPRRRKPVQAHR